jgi:hypothetical protein
MGFARQFSLTPPTPARRLRVELAKARAAERRAVRKLDKVLDERASAPPPGAEAGAEGPPRVNALELMRAWSSPGMVNLRSGLDARAEEQLRVRLVALLAGELGHGVWLKTLSAIVEAGRAADRLEEARFKKRKQDLSSPEGW